MSYENDVEKKSVNVIELITGKKVFFTKILEESAEQLVVEVVSKDGRVGRVTLEKRNIAQRTYWD